MNRTKLHHIPIYDIRFVVGVFDKTRKAEKMAYPWFGDVDLEGLSGAALHKGRQVGVFLDLKHGLNHEVIAHECFHATYRAMEWNGSILKKDCDEPHAHLCGYITRVVYSDLSQWRLKVKNNYGFNINWTPFKK